MISKRGLKLGSTTKTWKWWRFKCFILIFTLYCSNVCVSAPPCFDFGLPGVLGIAFGGFLIGVLLIGALWFIKIKTGNGTGPWSISLIHVCGFSNNLIPLNLGYPTGIDMSSTAAGLPGEFFFFLSLCLVYLCWQFFLSLANWLLSPLCAGCPCSGAKRQPVSDNLSPSENSSANASIGSTKSTPTSSMAWNHANRYHQQGHHLPSKSPIRVFVLLFPHCSAWKASPLHALFKFT